MKKKSLLASLLILVLTFSIILTSCGQNKEAAYPVKGKSITIIVERAAGGGTDLTARAIAPMLEKELGTPVVVVNKTGGDGVVGLNELAASKPDGYTLGVPADAVLAAHEVTYKEAKYKSDSFDYIANLNYTTYILILGPNSKFNSLKDVVEFAKANPKKLTVATPSGIPETMAAIKKGTGIDVTQITFDSGAKALAAIVGGQVDVALLTAQFAKQVTDQKLKIAASLSSARFPTCKDVPTFKEQGYSVVVEQNWVLSAPKGLPDDVKSILDKAMQKIGTSDEFKKKFEEMNAVPLYKNGVDTNKYVGENIKMLQDNFK